MIQDSGNRKQFSTGAVRDIHAGKGRCDLFPLAVVSQVLSDDTIFNISKFKETHNPYYADMAILSFVNNQEAFSNIYDALLEVSVHFEEGAVKYGENNWQKGIPCTSYIDSAIRHYLKYKRGDTDERHDRAFVWNLLCCSWTLQNLGWNGDGVVSKNSLEVESE